MANDSSRLIDAIYEASFVPELWKGILDRLGEMSDSIGGILITAGRNSPRWIASDAIERVMSDYVGQGWDRRNSRISRAMSRNHAGFLSDVDLYTAEELAVEPIYVQFYRPRGWGWAAGSVVNVPSGDLMVFAVEKLFDKGPIPPAVIQQLDLLRPHLARAGLCSARLGLERARNAVTAFEIIGLPAAVLTRLGRVVSANKLIESFGSQVQILARDQLAFTDRRAGALFGQALLHKDIEGPSVLSVPVPATAQDRGAVAHLVPLRGRSHDVFTPGDFVLLITPVSTPAPPGVDVLSGLFDLTPAEARVARAIGTGQTAEAIAASLSLSPETIRTQIKAVLAKAGVRRQVELVRLLTAMSFPGQRPQ